MAAAATLLSAGCTGAMGGEGGPPTRSGPTPAGGDSPGGATGSGPGTEGIGRTGLRRLTPTEYINTIRDLTGDDATPLMASLPADGRTAGFDNIAATLGVATTQLELFEQAASALAASALAPGSKARQKLIQCGDVAELSCQRSILEGFARRAWRRPVTSSEVERLLALARVAAEAGASADEQIGLVFRGILSSPQFLFRVELLPLPPVIGAYRVSPYELASRLSYFLWSSMPDDALLAAAAENRLSEPTALAAEVSRMLEDPKAEALTTNFASQWLGVRRLKDHAVDQTQFPGYTALVASLMAFETTQLFSHVLTSNLPVTELLTANYGFLDPVLAEQYGVAAPAQGSARVELSATPRRGLLGQAAILTLTSYPNRTSIVRRGVWALENLLCTEPPPPPPGVDTEPPPQIQGTLRQRMEQHRADPACAGCHTLMDPIGLGLENFDAIGTFRSSENGVAIDTRGELSGQPFTTLEELSKLIASDERFVPCALEKLSVFALGRTLTPGDEAEIHDLQGAPGEALGLKELVARTALSELFASQRAEP